MRIEWSAGRSVSARLSVPTTPSGPGLLLAHGAGGNQDSPFMAHLREGLATLGHPVLTFNYPYAEEGRRAPDRPAILLACHRAALDLFRKELGDRPVLGGKSMGGRMASHLVAEGEPGRALVLYGYPLHPPGRPEKLRADHLPSIELPMLFLTGTRDPLCRLDLLHEVLEGTTAEVSVIQGGDHSFKVPGTEWEQVLDELVTRTVTWLQSI